MPLVLPESSSVPMLVNDSTHVTTEALRGLSADTIVHEVKRLQHSIERLHDSNRQITQFCQEMDKQLAPSEKGEMETACSDNLITIQRQGDTITKLLTVLSEKTGGQSDMSSHYGFSVPQPPTSSSFVTQLNHDGVFL